MCRAGTSGTLVDMKTVDPPRRAPFGLSVLVALGWFTVTVAAVVVAWSGTPDEPDQDCSLVLSCLTPVEEATFFVMFYGPPILLGMLVVTTVITALLGRRIPGSGGR